MHVKQKAVAFYLKANHCQNVARIAERKTFALQTAVKYRNTSNGRWNSY